MPVLGHTPMTGKERVLAAFRGEVPDHTPWVPFAGIHAGRLKGYSPRRVLTDVDALVESLLEVNRLYRPDGQPVMFDLQLEAEALGIPLIWTEEALPMVASHPLAESKEVPTRIPGPGDGRIGLCLEAMRRMKREVGAGTALYGLVTGPFTLAFHLRGTELLMDLVLDPGRAGALIAYALAVSEAVAGYYIEAGMDVIAVVDPMVSQISPAHFEEFLGPAFAGLFASIRSRGALCAFFVCGNATRNLEAMCRARPDCISVDENVDLVAAKAIAEPLGIVTAGNLPLTTAMLLGSQADNAEAALGLIERAGPGRFILSPGCDMPYATPPENAIAAEQAAHNPLAARIVAAGQAAGGAFDIAVELPDYAARGLPLVEVFTLDSASCAACAYMLAAAMDMKAHFGERIEVLEYKYTKPENVARCRALGVKNLPSIYVDGKLAWSSLIPPREEFEERMAAALEAKGRG
jgi:uroporphyrinogen decarboxylase